VPVGAATLCCCIHLLCTYFNPFSFSFLYFDYHVLHYSFCL
jgi:hypothetical protein